MPTASLPLPAPEPAPVAWLRHHPADWQPGTLDRDALGACAQALATQPGFDAAVRRFAHCWHEGYTSSPQLVSVMRNNARYVLLLACLWLDHRRDPRMPEVGVTASRLLEFHERIDRRLVEGGLSRIKDILSHARAAGLLQPAAPGPAGFGAGSDARRRPLEPTPALRQAMAGYVAGFLRGVDPLLPLPASPQQMVQTPGFIGELFTYRLSGLLHDRYAINQGLPAMAWVTNREKGYPMLLALLRSAQWLPEGGARVQGTAGDMAEFAGISRGTARNFLLACTERGWFVAEPRHHWRLSPAFHAELLQWMGREFLWMHTLASAAWRRVQPAGG